MEEATLTPKFVSQRCGIKVSSLHFYEEKGLIRSWRNQGNQRRYKKDVLRRIAIIKAAQKMGLGLAEIKQTFSEMPNERTPDKKDWQLLSQRWQQQLDERIRQLQEFRDSVDGCIGCGCLSLTKCPIYNQEDHLADQGAGPVLLNNKLEN